jgi:N-carbamoyl-L-amino-acid hydrolase
VEDSATALGLRSTRLLSFAGHDSQTLSIVTPTVLFFVPSVDGISHNPAEFTHPANVVNGANVLLHTLLRLANQTAINPG